MGNYHRSIGGCHSYSYSGIRASCNTRAKESFLPQDGPLDPSDSGEPKSAGEAVDQEEAISAAYPSTAMSCGASVESRAVKKQIVGRGRCEEAPSE